MIKSLANLQLLLSWKSYKEEIRKAAANEDYAYLEELTEQLIRIELEMV
jgi:hypothetical protein